MANSYFRFKEFTVHQERCGMKVCTDSCLFGAWVARHISACDKILDIGSGTGLLMLMLAQQTPAQIDGIELDPDCFGQLLENLHQSPWQNRLNAYQGDVRHFQFQHTYPVILSNPPFYENLLHSQTHSTRLARHSVSLSLTEFFAAINRNLDADGEAFILMPFSRREELLQAGSDHSLQLVRTMTVRQTENHTPFRIFFHLSRHGSKEPIHEEITIKEKGNYSREFSELLKPYYLAL